MYQWVLVGHIISGFGIWLMVLGSHHEDGWIHAKIFLVILMSAFHMFCAKWVKDFASDQNNRPAKFFRFANEMPTLLMILIVILVVVKPF